MSLKFRVGGSTLLAKTLKPFRDGVLRSALSAKQMIGGDLVLIFATSGGGGGGAFSLSVPATSSGTGQSSTIISRAITVTPSGGVAPYTYAWTVVSYNHPSISPRLNSPTFATTTVSQPSMAPGDEYSAIVQCVCTDSVGQTASGTCLVSFLRRPDISDL